MKITGTGTGELPKPLLITRTGVKLWGSNFGPATAIRFSPVLRKTRYSQGLRACLVLKNVAFPSLDLREASVKAAAESVDFSTLFLSLGFFIILSSVVLLILVISDSMIRRKNRSRHSLPLVLPADGSGN